jgi:hypothetical protein
MPQGVCTAVVRNVGVDKCISSGDDRLGRQPSWLTLSIGRGVRVATGAGIDAALRVEHGNMAPDASSTLDTSAKGITRDEGGGKSKETRFGGVKFMC